MSLSKDSASATRTGSETPPSIAKDSPQGKTASVASSSTNVHLRANLNDADHPPDRTVWLGELEPWMDDHYMVQVCSLFGWETFAIHIPRPPAAPNATKHPNNAGYCLLIFPTHEKAKKVVDAYGPDASPAPGSQPVLLPNSNRPIRLDWVISPSAQAAIGKDPGPVDNAIEYSIFVGDIAADVTNSDLMNVFRNPNLGLRGDFPPRLIAPFLSCCNAKVMVDSITGISKGYGFVRFTSEADQKRALVEMQGLYCKSRPMRLSTATAKNKNTNPDEDVGEPIPVVVHTTTTPSSNGPVSPSNLDPSRIRSITTAVAEGASARGPQRNEFHPVLLAKIAQLSNTLGNHFPAYKNGIPGNGAPSVLPPPGLNTQQIQQWLISNPQARAQLETLLGNGNDPLAPSDPLNTTVFVGGLSPLISEDTLRTFFAPFGPIHYVKVPPGKSCGFVQFVRKADAERAIEGLSGYSIGGSKVRLSWGRIPAAQGAAQAAAAAAAANAAASLSPVHMQHQGMNRPMTGQSPIQSTPADGPLSNEQALSLVERLIPALLPAANNSNPPNGTNVGMGGGPGTMSPGGAYNNANLTGPVGLGNAGGPRSMHQSQHPMQHRGMGPGYRDPYPGFNNVAPSPSYMHGGAASSPYNHRPGDFGRNDYAYYDMPNSAGGPSAYGGTLPYGGIAGMNVAGSMSPAMGGMTMPGFGGGSGHVLEDQLLGTYGGGIHRLQTSSLRQGGGFSPSPGGGNFNPSTVASNFMAGMGTSGFNSDYDADVGAYRPSFGGVSGTFGGPATGYAGFSNPQSPYVNGSGLDASDRFSGRMNMSGGLNGFVPAGSNANGLSGHTGTGPGSAGGFDYGEESSPQFKAADILRQDSSGLASYLVTTSNAGATQTPGIGHTAPGARANVNASSAKANGHVNVLASRGTSGSNSSNSDGLDGLSSVFGGFRIGDLSGTATGSHKSQLSPGASSGLSGNSFASQQVFRTEAGRYS